MPRALCTIYKCIAATRRNKERKCEVCIRNHTRMEGDMQKLTELTEESNRRNHARVGGGNWDSFTSFFSLALNNLDKIEKDFAEFDIAFRRKLTAKKNALKKQPAITFYGANCEEVRDLLIDLIGDDEFVLDVEPPASRHLMTVMLLRMEDLPKARNALLEHGYKSKMHCFDAESKIQPPQKKKNKKKNNEDYKKVLTLYGSDIFMDVVSIIKNAVGEDQFLMSLFRDEIMTLHLVNEGDANKVRKALLPKGYHMHISEVLYNVETSKAAVSERATTSMLRTPSSSAAPSEPAAIKKDVDVDDFQRVFTLYDVNCKEMRNLLLSGVLGESDFYMDVEPEDLVTVYLQEDDKWSENCNQVHKKLLEMPQNLNIHTWDRPQTKKTTNDSATFDNYTPALSVYGAEKNDVLLAIYPQMHRFYANTAKNNEKALHLRKTVSFEKVRNTLLERCYHVHTSDALKATMPKTESANGLTKVVESNKPPMLGTKCAAAKVKSTEAVMNEEQEGDKFLRPFTVYGAYCKKLRDILYDMVGRDGFDMEYKPTNLVTIFLLKNDKWLENVDKARNALLDSGHNFGKHNLHIWQAPPPNVKFKGYWVNINIGNYKPALTLYDTKSSDIENALINAVGKDNFLLSRIDQNYMAVNLVKTADLEKVRTTLLEKDYEVHGSVDLTNTADITDAVCATPSSNLVESSKATIPEAKCPAAEVKSTVAITNKEQEDDKFLRSFTVYGANCKKLRNILSGIVGKDDFNVVYKPTNLLTVLLLQKEKLLKNLDKARNALLECGYIFGKHNLHTWLEPQLKGDWINTNNHKYKIALTLYDTKFNEIEDVLNKAVGKDNFLLCLINQNYMAVELLKSADLDKVRSTLLKKEYDVHISVDLTNIPDVGCATPSSNLVESSKATMGEIKSTTDLRNLAESNTTKCPAAVEVKSTEAITNIEQEDDNFLRPFTVYGAHCKKLRDILYDIVGRGGFVVDYKPTNLVTILLLKNEKWLENVEKARNALLESGHNFGKHNLHAWQAPPPNVKSKGYWVNINIGNYKPALNLYDTKSSDIENSLIIAVGKDNFLLSRIDQNYMAVNLVKTADLEKVRTTLLEKDYEVHSSVDLSNAMSKPDAAVCTTSSNLVDSSKATIPETKYPAAAEEEKSTLAITNKEQQDDKFLRPFTVYGIDCEKLRKILSGMVGKDTFNVVYRPTNLFAVMLLQNEKLLENIEKARNALLESGYILGKHNLHTWQAPPPLKGDWKKTNNYKYKIALTLYDTESNEIENVLINAVGKGTFILGLITWDCVAVHLLTKFSLPCKKKITMFIFP
ncbi:uncharacterized protein [Musca autumnalis]|uniref:uncharacterized protein n=1 Tax=Musca autumnalis TaxID=221902 RepID=UPI003CFA8623